MAAATAPPTAAANVATNFSGSVAKTSEESARLERRADVQVTMINQIQSDPSIWLEKESFQQFSESL